MSDCILPVMGDNLSTKLCSGKKLRKVIDATCTSTSTSFRDFTFSGITAAELKSLLIGSCGGSNRFSYISTILCIRAEYNQIQCGKHWIHGKFLFRHL